MVIAEEGATVGKLYLGDKLIADGETAEINTLSELTDVVIGAGVPNGAVLAYDAKNQVWKETLLESILSDIIGLMTGASSTENGASGMVPQPMAGQQNLFLRGDATWADPTTELREVVSSLDEVVKQNKTKHEQDIATLLGGRPLQAIDDIVNEHVAKVINGAPEAFDTLQELAAWIADHEEAIDITETLNRLSRVESSLYDEATGLVIQMEGVQEVLYGDGTTSGLVAQTANLISRVMTAEQNIIDLQDVTRIHGDDISAIYNLLKWQDLYDDGV